MGTVSQFWLSLESNKNEHSRGWRWSCKCSCPHVNVLFSFLKIKNILLFQELLFYYPEFSFYLRFLIAFQSISLVFEKNLLFIYCKCFFSKNAFFQPFVSSPCPAQSFWERWYLPCCCFVSSWNSLLTKLSCLLDTP